MSPRALRIGLGASLAIIHKRRDPDVPNEVRVFEVVGDEVPAPAVVLERILRGLGGQRRRGLQHWRRNGRARLRRAASLAARWS